MMVKLIGAVLIIAGCGGVGLSMCYALRREEQAMEQLLQSLDWMILELNYRMPSLATLCRGAAETCKGTLGRVFRQFADELDNQLSPDVATCMNAALAEATQLPGTVEAHLKALGTSMGRFDLHGQISELEAAAARCKRELQLIGKGKEARLRNYQTLGLCAGVALVIILL